MPQRKKFPGKHSSPQPPKQTNSPFKGPAKARPGAVRGTRIDESRLLNQKLAFFFLAAITFIAYANAWPDNLTFDDRIFADSERFAAIGPAQMWRFFTEDLWSASGTRSNLYRPLLLVLITVESWMFGDWFAGYHLINIFLHVLATLLVYGLVRHLLLGFGTQFSVADSSALLAGVVFGVHPIHTEVVNSVFNGSEILVCIGVAGGLWWFLHNVPEHPKKAWLGLSLVYLFILFCRESGAALPVLAVALLWLSSTGHWLLRVRQCLPVFVLLIPLGIFLTMRTHALEPSETVQVANAVESAEPISEPDEQEETISDLVGVEVAEQEEAAGEPEDEHTAEQPAQPGKGSILRNAMEAFSPERLLNTANSARRLIRVRPDQMLPAVGLWFESWKILLWPHPLQVYYDKPDKNSWIALVTQLALLAAALAGWIRKRPGLLAGVAFFYIAILPSSKMFGHADVLPGLADRALYLPSVGLAIIIAVGLVALVRHLDVRYAVGAIAMVAMILMPLTWARNAEWEDDVTLFESDYAKLDSKDPILDTLLAAHLRDDNLQRAVGLCDTHAGVVQSGSPLGIHCGSAYGRVGRYADAEQAYLSAASGWSKPARVFAHVNLAMMYHHQGRRSDAERQFELGIAAEKHRFMKEYFSALKLLQLYPNDRVKMVNAKKHLEKALDLQPQHVESRKELAELNARLSSAQRGKQ